MMAAGLSPEQQAFLDRKAREVSPSISISNCCSTSCWCISPVPIMSCFECIAPAVRLLMAVCFRLVCNTACVHPYPSSGTHRLPGALPRSLQLGAPALHAPHLAPNWLRGAILQPRLLHPLLLPGPCCPVWRPERRAAGLPGTQVTGGPLCQPRRSAHPRPLLFPAPQLPPELVPCPGGRPEQLQLLCSRGPVCQRAER